MWGTLEELFSGGLKSRMGSEDTDLGDVDVDAEGVESWSLAIPQAQPKPIVFYEISVCRDPSPSACFAPNYTIA